MRYLIPVLAVLALSACETTTPEQRCVGYTGAIWRYEAMLDRGEVLTSTQRAAYDFALAGAAATCAPLPPPE